MIIKKQNKKDWQSYQIKNKQKTEAKKQQKFNPIFIIYINQSIKKKNEQKITSTLQPETNKKHISNLQKIYNQ